MPQSGPVDVQSIIDTLMRSITSSPTMQLVDLPEVGPLYDLLRQRMLNEQRIRARELAARRGVGAGSGIAEQIFQELTQRPLEALETGRMQAEIARAEALNRLRQNQAALQERIWRTQMTSILPWLYNLQLRQRQYQDLVNFLKNPVVQQFYGFGIYGANRLGRGRGGGGGGSVVQFPTASGAAGFWNNWGQPIFTDENKQKVPGWASQ